MDAKITDLIGQTLTKIEGGTPKDIFMILTTAEGNVYVMEHYQDCCERVEIEELIGDLNDLLNSPLLDAREESNQQRPEGFKHTYTSNGVVYDSEPDSETWTFYKFQTIKGSVTVRWCGTSNGYYSERVDFYKKD